MKQVTTVTLTFKLPHKSGETGITSIRSLIDKLRQYDDDGEIELVTDEDTDAFTFMRHNGKFSHQFGFNDMDTFVRKYSKTGSHEITSVVRDYGQFVSCESKTEEVEDAEHK